MKEAHGENKIMKTVLLEKIPQHKIEVEEVVEERVEHLIQDLTGEDLLQEWVEE